MFDGRPVVYWISSLDVGGSEGHGVSWIDFDEEASLFTRDEGRNSVSLISSRIRKYPAWHRRATTFRASPGYTLVLTVDTISST